MALGFRGFNRKKGGNPFVPFTQTFNYTGVMQSLHIPYKGLYKIELYGAQGADVGGNGGYTVGYKQANKDEIWYIGVGGRGTNFNGGGGAVGTTHGGAGGGGTHVGYTNAPIKNTTVANLIGVAGGGGSGSPGLWSSFPVKYGGTGGGTNGGNSSGGNDEVAYGGSQNAGGSNSNYSALNGSYGQGGSTYTASYSGQTWGNGGGGGYYGGAGGNSYDCAGGGGSGYIGGMPTITYKGTTYTPSMTNGVNAGHGKVVITRMA